LINLKKELVIFLILFVVTSVVVHLSAWMANPMFHMQALFSHVIPYHPILYVFLIYIIIVVLRVVLFLVLKLFKR